MRVVVGVVVAFLAIVAVSAGAFAQNLLSWEDRTDFAGGTDLGRDVTVTGRTMIMAGNASETGGGVNTVVRAHDVRSGDVLWTDYTPAQSGVLTGVFVTSASDMAFAASYMTEPLCAFCTDIFVRAYDAATGLTLWQDVFDKGRDDLPQGIAASSRVVVVVGYGGNSVTPPITAIDFIVRAYDPATGAILWEDLVDNGPFIDDAARAVAIEGNRVFVAGTTAAIGSFSEELILRAYEATTGELVWELRRPDAFPVAVSVDADLVSVAGGAGLQSPSLFLGSYDVTDGHQRWEDTSGSGVFFDVKTRARRLVAVGQTDFSSAIVRVYDRATGAVRWKDITNPAPGFNEFYGSVGVSNKAIYVAGRIAAGPFGNRDFLVRAYDLRTGALLLDDPSHSSAESAAAAIAVYRNRVFAVGYTSETSNTDFLSRAYNVKHLEAPGWRTD
jgi:hypothetical protein